MKKLLFPLTIVLAMSSTSYAENIQEEAIESLSTAQTFVRDGNFNKAIEEINYALAKINELTAEELLKFIPDPPDGFELVSKQSQGVGTGVSSITGNAGATASYSHSNGATVNLNIAIGGMTGKMASIAALGSIFAGLGQETGAGQTRQVRVQGYTGTEMSNINDKSGTLTFQVGDKASITIEGNGIDSVEILMQLAKKINFPGIEKSF